MLKSINAIQWLHWKVFLQLSPQGEERSDLRFASICKAIWNVQIAKAAGSSPPKYRDIAEFVLRFGDAPEILPPAPTKNLSPKDLWSRLTAVVKSIAKPKVA